MHQRLAVYFALLLTVASLACADEANQFNSKVRASIERAIPLIEAGAAGSAEQRQCFTCHNQALPILALTAAQHAGFAIDDVNLDRQLKHTLDHLKRGQKNYLAGKGQGGKVITAGYALLALETGGHVADDTTTAVTSYLLKYQKESDHWSHPGNRPPSSGSDFTTTALALRGLASFGATKQQADIESRKAVVREWLAKTQPKDTEDRVFQLHASKALETGLDQTVAAVTSLLQDQRDDGGWSQTEELESDAYATSTVLVALLQSDESMIADSSIQRGIKYLIETQCDDGSWHVQSRAKAFQTYYESGFPHQEDQFISIAASCWATMALVLSLPESGE